MGLFDKLTETIGDFLMKNYFAALLHVFANGLQDQDQRVRVASLKYANHFLKKTNLSYSKNKELLGQLFIIFLLLKN